MTSPVMLKSAIARTVEFCVEHAAIIILAALVAAAAASVYVVQNFAITTDITKLISAEDSQVQSNTKAFEAAFPQRKILVVVEAPTPELVQQAADRLTTALRARSDVFASVLQPAGGEFFQRNALLFMRPEEVAAITGRLIEAKPLLGALASDPTLRGIANSLSFAIVGVQQGQFAIEDLSRPLTLAADTLEEILAGRPASFSWRVLIEGRPATTEELRRFIAIDPIIDYAALEPGKAATDAVRQIAAEQGITSELQVRIKLTGEVPIRDEQFSTIRDSAPVEITVAVVVVLFVLWLALRSLRLILPVVLGLAIGFAVTAGFGLLAVGRLNLISVAFAVLFMGIGVDFGLQFTVRYRSERHDIDEVRLALDSAARKSGVPLALAAAATAAAFFSFLPTDFRGLAELGLIAGVGMIIALLTTITVVPAGLRLLKPAPEPRHMGFEALRPLDRFMMRRRIPIVVATVGTVALASPLLLKLQFDFNPIHLQNPKVEAVATFLELRNDPTLGANAINVLAPSLPEATRIADRLARLPEVARTVTLHSFVPEGQDRSCRPFAAPSPRCNPFSLQPAALEPKMISRPFRHSVRRQRACHNSPARQRERARLLRGGSQLF
jgi:hopanoid biosynthesis associated RND transporter like protein HpnN